MQGSFGSSWIPFNKQGIAYFLETEVNLCSTLKITFKCRMGKVGDGLWNNICSYRYYTFFSNGNNWKK